jgi:hypothetical protein
MQHVPVTFRASMRLTAITTLYTHVSLLHALKQYCSQAAARREAAAAYAVELAAREAKLKDVFDKLKEDPR